MNSAIQAYLTQIRRNLATGAATEHTHRPALAALLEALAPGVKAINEPQRIACGAPDLAVLRDGFTVAHVEAKDVGVPLDGVERSEQLMRYREALSSLVLTDYLEFRWYVDGELRRVARLARWDGESVRSERDGAANVAQLLADVLAHEPQPIATPRELAERMARLTHLVREIIVTAFETERASDLLHGWRQAFAEVLVADLDQPERVAQFADMFAQTLAYGLFSARVMHDTPGPFTRQVAQTQIPPTNPFLRDFFYQITGPRLDAEPYAGFVNDLVQLLAQADMGAILADFGRRTRREDPTVHFYETFLAAYDPKLREARGVYYTPAPVVSFIVRSVDALLKSHFDLPDGLADTSKVTVRNADPGQRVKGKPNAVRKTADVHKVLVLDPAVGTATFLYSVIDLIRDRFMQTGNAGLWSGYVRDHLLPRLFGFELLMAPYAVAHFKLALQLAGHDLPEPQRATWAYDFATEERIGIYLTNTLEGPHEHTGLPLFTQFLARESAAADEIKRELPIMVVLGNPPYSGHSANQNPWIDDLLHGQLPDGSRTTSYYEVDGKPLGERNPKWLQDDYVKFIRFGQWRIEQSGGGILAFISNNGYLDNPTFRGMRQSLLETFTDIYILDLHGNARKKETSPDGTPDENVFDIMQGVAIGLFVKEPGEGGPATVHHTDVWGRRDDKYRLLSDIDINSGSWVELSPRAKHYLFLQRDFDLQSEYHSGYEISAAFELSSMGVTTGRDSFAVAMSQSELQSRIADLAGELQEEDLRLKYGLRDSSSFRLAEARSWAAQANADEAIEAFDYRCFDRRYVIYASEILARHRDEVCKHLIDRDNFVLITFRAIRDASWQHVCVARFAVAKEYISSLDNCYMLPLYLYPEDNATTLFDDTALSSWPPDPAHGGRVPNLAPDFVTEMAHKLDLTFDPHQIALDPGPTFGPEAVLRYIYAIFHSPTYRERYAEFLKIDFPRVPLTADPDLFWRLVALGDELVQFHLLDHPGIRKTITHYPIPGDNTVAPRGGYPKYTPPNPDQEIEGRVWINKTQYVAGVPEDVWNFQIGGYQVLHKWLKDRRGRQLTFDNLAHYRQIVVALRATMRLMDEIDVAIPAWPVT
jgi:predicted helicase